jgi:short-subunit dehydrogenase
MTHHLIIGASRGLGAAFAQAVPNTGDTAWLVSRARPATLDRDDGITRHWIQADLTLSSAATEIAAALGNTPLDVLLYNAGIWERGAFGGSYRFDASPLEETQNVLAVNLSSAILCVQALLPNLRQSTNPKIILIGSTSGLENVQDREVAYVASKFGLRGATYALRESLRADQIAVTTINPGNIATEVPYDAGIEGAMRDGTGIPMQDLVALVRCVISLSRGSAVKEIDIPAMSDTNA